MEGSIDKNVILMVDPPFRDLVLFQHKIGRTRKSCIEFLVFFLLFILFEDDLFPIIFLFILLLNSFKKHCVETVTSITIFSGNKEILLLK